MKKLIMDILQNGNMDQLLEIRKITMDKEDIKYIDKQIKMYEMIVKRDAENNLNKGLYL